MSSCAIKPFCQEFISASLLPVCGFGFFLQNIKPTASNFKLTVQRRCIAEISKYQKSRTSVLPSSNLYCFQPVLVLHKQERAFSYDKNRKKLLHTASKTAVTASQADAKVISMDAAAAAVLSEPDGIFTFKVKQRTDGCSLPQTSDTRAVLPLAPSGSPCLLLPGSLSSNEI